MAAGVLAKSGYFMGDHLNPANETNPKGQFEDREVNSINELLLEPIVPSRPRGLIGKILFRDRPKFGQRWLARIPLDAVVVCSSHLADKIKALTSREPFCFKDPRFSYTLPAWRPYLNNTVFICVFRDPRRVVASILKQSQTVDHLKDFRINTAQAFEVWEHMYSHILKKHYQEGGEWIFLHYEQFLDGSAFPILEEALKAKVDRCFVDRQLNRSVPVSKIPDDVYAIYVKLCHLASFSPSTE